MNVDALKDVHIDILREIGNIGAGNATTALSKMLNKPINMGVPKVNVLEFKDVSTVLGGEETEVVGILLTLSGDISGMMMFILDFKSAARLVNILMGKDVEDISSFDEMELSAMQEIGNILAGSYLNSLAALTNLTIAPSVPHLTIDMAGAILSVPAIEFSKVGEKVLFIETGFSQGEHMVEGYYILIPDMISFKKLLNTLGVE